jgi:hypothetical protein
MAKPTPAEVPVGVKMAVFYTRNTAATTCQAACMEQHVRQQVNRTAGGSFTKQQATERNMHCSNTRSRGLTVLGVLLPIKHQLEAYHAYQAAAAVQQGTPTVACSAETAGHHGHMMEAATHGIAVQPS